MSRTLLPACIWSVLALALTPFPQHTPFVLAVGRGVPWAVALFICAALICRYPRMYPLRHLRHLRQRLSGGV